jgi:hypothetical protein
MAKLTNEEATTLRDLMAYGKQVLIALGKELEHSGDTAQAHRYIEFLGSTIARARAKAERRTPPLPRHADDLRNFSSGWCRCGHPHPAECCAALGCSCGAKRTGVTRY